MQMEARARSGKQKHTLLKITCGEAHAVLVKRIDDIVASFVEHGHVV